MCITAGNKKVLRVGDGGKRVKYSEKHISSKLLAKHGFWKECKNNGNSFQESMLS